MYYSWHGKRDVSKQFLKGGCLCEINLLGTAKLFLTTFHFPPLMNQPPYFRLLMPPKNGCPYPWYCKP